MDDETSKNGITARRVQSLLSQELIIYLLSTHAEEISLDLVWPKTLSNLIVNKIIRHRIARQIVLILIKDYSLKIREPYRLTAGIEKMLAMMGVGTHKTFDRTTKGKIL